MNLEAIDPDRLLAIARSGSPAAMAAALTNVSKALKHSRGQEDQIHDKRCPENYVAGACNCGYGTSKSTDDQTHE